MKRLVFGVSMASAVALAPAVRAQGLGDRVDIGAFGQFTRIDPAIRMDNVIAGGIRGGISLTKWLGVEADVQAGPSKAQRTPFESITYRPFHGLATVTLPLTASQKTSLILGGGYLLSVYSGRSTANEYEDGFTALAGLRFCTGSKWSLRVDGLVDNNPSPNEQALAGTSRNVGLRAGMSYALRGACADATPFDWGLAIAPATATVPRGSAKPYALSAKEAAGRPIELPRVMNLACSSSDPSVATVDNSAKVTAVKAGSATISCKGLVKKIERTASATVTVPPPAWTHTLTPPSGTTEVGKTLAFTATAVDADKVDLGTSDWSSANAAIATVSSGTVTCVGAGSTMITASKTAYGETKRASASVTCTAPPAAPAARLALDETQFDFNGARVTRSGIDTLGAVLEALRRNPSLRVSIEGHTDRYGSASFNVGLSESRVQAVRRQLLLMAGADRKAIESRVSTKAFGEQCLLTTAGADESEPPPSGRRQVAAADRAAQATNRRVELWQLPDGTDAPTSCRSTEERTARVPFRVMK